MSLRMRLQQRNTPRKSKYTELQLGVHNCEGVKMRKGYKLKSLLLCLNKNAFNFLWLLFSAVRSTFCLKFGAVNVKGIYTLLDFSIPSTISVVYIHVWHRSWTNRVCKMSIWFFSGEDKCPNSHYFLVSADIVGLFFVTLGHRTADPVTCWSPMVWVYIQLIKTATAIFFSQLATEWHRSAVSYRLP